MKYRKKPVVIDAVQWDGTNRDAIHDFCPVATSGSDGSGNPRSLYIKTKEGVMEALIGDWIIKGVVGEFYPCKPEVFAATYEAV